MIWSNEVLGSNLIETPGNLWRTVLWAIVDFIRFSSRLLRSSAVWIYIDVSLKCMEFLKLWGGFHERNLISPVFCAVSFGLKAVHERLLYLRDSFIDLSMAGSHVLFSPSLAGFSFSIQDALFSLRSDASLPHALPSHCPVGKLWEQSTCWDPLRLALKSSVRKLHMFWSWFPAVYLFQTSH